MRFPTMWYVRPAKPHREIRAFARRLNIHSMSDKLLTEYHFELLSLKGGCTGSSESTLVKSYIVGNHISRLKCIYHSQEPVHTKTHNLTKRAARNGPVWLEYLLCVYSLATIPNCIQARTSDGRCPICSESSLGVRSNCWFRHALAHILINDSSLQYKTISFYRTVVTCTLYIL